MSRIEDTTNPMGPESQIDRLVDGELNETDRHELLLQLEREPEGWRRCALAFLEAQCWRQELGLMARSPENVAAVSSPAMSAAATVRTRTPRWRQNLATALSMGACFLIALWLGLSMRGNGAGGLHGPGGEAVPAMAVLPSDEVVTIEGQNGKTENVSIPRAHRDTFDSSLAKQVPDAIPLDVQQAFQRSGHQVVQQREIVPVPMNNGRRLMVPVDHVEIHYVGRGSL
jgi:hypothetical protein